MTWNACDISIALFPVLQVLWRNNIASAAENTSWKPLEMPFLRLLSLDASALASFFTWTYCLLFVGNYPSLNTVYMCCHLIKKAKLNDVCVPFKHSNIWSKMLDMYSERPRFQNFSRNSHLRCKVFLLHILQSFCYLLKILLKTLIML